MTKVKSKETGLVNTNKDNAASPRRLVNKAPVSKESPRPLVSAVSGSSASAVSQELLALRSELRTELDGLRDKISRRLSIPTSSQVNPDVYNSLKLYICTAEEEWELRLSQFEQRLLDIESNQLRLESELDQLNQYGRRPCLILHGLPEKPKEDSCQVILETLNSKLHIKLEKSDLVTAHRMGRTHSSTSNKKHRPLIVEFVKMTDRDLIYKKKRGLKGSGLILSESLSPRRKYLYDQARLNGLICWTFYGDIFVLNKTGQKIIIRSEDDLRKLSD